MEYAYVRVSTKDQNIERQMIAMTEYGICPRNIYCDCMSGKTFERPAYQKLMRQLRAKDVLVIKSIDRLGRNYDEILRQWQRITKEIEADIVVLDMDLLDTRKKAGGLTGAFIADLVLQILAYVAQTEREFIHQRQAEGIAAAKASGVKFGRPQVNLPDNFHTIAWQWKNRQISIEEALLESGLSESTFYRKVRKMREVK